MSINWMDNTSAVDDATENHSIELEAQHLIDMNSDIVKKQIERMDAMEKRKRMVRGSVMHLFPNQIVDDCDLKFDEVAKLLLVINSLPEPLRTKLRDIIAIGIIRNRSI